MLRRCQVQRSLVVYLSVAIFLITCSLLLVITPLVDDTPPRETPPNVKAGILDSLAKSASNLFTSAVDAFSYYDESNECGRLRNKRAAWYGSAAYPVITDESQAWSWVKTFLGAACAGCRNDSKSELFDRVLHPLKQKAKSSDSAQRIAVIRFAQLPPPELETRVGSLAKKNSMEVQRTNISRSFCTNDTHCRPASSLPIRTVADFILITGSVADFYDMTQIVACQSDADYLLTTIYTEPRDDINNERYATLFHDWLNVMYFEYDWIPFVTNEHLCDESRFNCTIWIAWKKYQPEEPLTFFPPAADGSLPYEIERLSSFFNKPDQSACIRREQFGGSYDNEVAKIKVDGMYTLCMDIFPNRSPDDCLVYSFGIRDDWRFDDQLHSMGCSVFSFDPSIEQNTSQRAAHHYFYKWGLVYGREHFAVKRPDDWILKTVQQIRVDLNHTKRKLDVIKMDCESSEMTFLDGEKAAETLRSVGQLALEVHWMPADWGRSPEDFNGVKVVRNMARIIHRLEKLGFVMFFSRPTPKQSGFDFRAYNRSSVEVTGSQSFVYEVSFLNTDFTN
ncbi:uncharacterized protein LOC129586071 [Paramacrobiotus metropolitanus]|uniref:uncharacterized protein LOC129586071 n=1 Tax=Paramacrobiotus metropolitanus TaxID=2943436 RepID=UPI0024460073|nr:uncharacterized protein LOC129586071 [Paramacrobiotus metropolitanus]